jgi:hypothetical protein
MFRAEIENSLEDADALFNLYEKRYHRDEITNYVYNENGVFLTQEITGLRGILTFLDTLKPEKFSSVEDIASEIDSMIKKKVEDFEDPEAIYGIVSRRIKKILNYLNMKSE